MDFCKSYYRSHKKLLVRKRKIRVCTVEEKIRFSENTDFKSEKKYVSPKIVQRTIPESINAKQIFDRNGLCDLRRIDPATLH